MLHARNRRWRSLPARAHGNDAAGNDPSMNDVLSELDPPPRILMGPGPVGVDPRVLRAMSMPMLGQFDPAFTAYMNETMELLRRLYRTQNQWSLVVDGTARAGIEAILVSIIA